MTFFPQRPGGKFENRKKFGKREEKRREGGKREFIYYLLVLSHIAHCTVLHRKLNKTFLFSHFKKARFFCFQGTCKTLNCKTKILKVFCTYRNLFYLFCNFGSKMIFYLLQVSRTYTQLTGIFRGNILTTSSTTTNIIN